MIKILSGIIDRILHPLAIGQRRQRRSPLVITKRQKFLISVLILTGSLFFSEYVFNFSAIFLAVGLALFTDIFLFVALYKDLRESFSPHAFFLPFLCSLAFGLFYFLTPARFISRIILTSLYAISLYALFLSENIFLVASIRTIALLNSARIVTFVISLLSYFFLSNIVFSFRLSFFPTTLLISSFTLFFVIHALWTYTLEKSLTKDFMWPAILTLCLVELAAILWFWPTSPTMLALFLTASFYTLMGLSHSWLDKRLFQGVFWEYSWVISFACILLIWVTHWQG